MVRISDGEWKTTGARKRKSRRERLWCHLCYHTSQALMTAEAVFHSQEKPALHSQNTSTAEAQLKENSSVVLFTIHQHEPPPQLMKSSLLRADQICLLGPTFIQPIIDSARMLSFTSLLGFHTVTHIHYCCLRQISSTEVVAGFCCFA